LALCRALLNSPDLLILDEPMNGLDPKSVNEIRTLLKRLSKEKNMTIFISSHVLSEVEKLADTIGFLSKGALVKTIDIKNAFMKKVDRLFMTVSNSIYGMEILKLNGYECYESKAERLVIYADESDVNKILKLMVAHDIGVEEVYFKPQDLEDMFMELVEK
jgi:ABC-type multidrug transport system ATPase subunit